MALRKAMVIPPRIIAPSVGPSPVQLRRTGLPFRWPNRRATAFLTWAVGSNTGQVEVKTRRPCPSSASTAMTDVVLLTACRLALKGST